MITNFYPVKWLETFILSSTDSLSWALFSTLLQMLSNLQNIDIYWFIGHQPGHGHGGLPDVSERTCRQLLLELFDLTCARSGRVVVATSAWFRWVVVKLGENNFNIFQVLLPDVACEQLHVDITVPGLSYGTTCSGNFMSVLITKILSWLGLQASGETAGGGDQGQRHAADDNQVLLQ